MGVGGVGVGGVGVGRGGALGGGGLDPMNAAKEPWGWTNGQTACLATPNVSWLEETTEETRKLWLKGGMRKARKLSG